eukprot:GSChrysophyteH1.ASY1.ANO1.1331.1 assembled CDS
MSEFQAVMASSTAGKEHEQENLIEEQEIGGLASELSQFVDRDAVVKCINELCSASVTDSIRDFDKSFEWLSDTLAKYQEQPMLIAAALPDMVEPLTNRLLYLVEVEDTTTGQCFDQTCKVLQLICRVRGFKYVMKIFPHEVSQLEPCLNSLSNTSLTSHSPAATSANFLQETGPAREAASACLSSLLTRPDMDSGLLTDFIGTACKASMSLGNSTFEIIALSRQSNQVTIRKLTCKLIQRIGMTYLPPRVAAWRYERGQRSLLKNLGDNNDDNDAAATAGSRDALDKQQKISEPPLADGVDLDELEDIIDHLLTSLTDKDTAVLEIFADPNNESAWHGGCLALAELTRRGLLLPERLQDAMPILEKAIHFDIVRGQHSVGAHVRDAACYVCWAFARAYSPQVMRPFIKSMSASMLITCLYDHYFSLGNRVNAYLQIAPEIAKMDDDHHATLMYHLADIKVAHWDAGIRQLCSKAIAQLVPINASRSLEILSELIAECFSANFAVRHGSLLCVAEIVLALETSSNKLPEAVVEQVVGLVPKLDKSRLFRGRGGELMRQASCSLLENIAKANLQFPLKTRVTLVEFLNENLRHPQEYIQEGAADALREILFSYFSSGIEDPSERLQKLTVQLYMNGLNTEENVAATRGYALALGVLPARLLCQPRGRFVQVLECLAASAQEDRKIAGDTDAETRRYCVYSLVEAVEKVALSEHFTIDALNIVQKCLVRSSKDYTIDKRGDTGSWSRIAAIKGMERLIYACQRHLAGPSADATTELFMTSWGPARLAAEAYEARDTGSVALATSPPLVQRCADHDWYLSFLEANAREFVGIVLSQLAEKLDAVREVAGKSLQEVLSEQNHAAVESIQDRELLVSAISSQVYSTEKLSSINVQWAHPAHVFPILLRIMQSKAYFHQLLSGFVIAIGGLSETVVKASSHALLEFCKNNVSRVPSQVSEQHSYCTLLCDSLIRLFKEYTKDDRVVIPLLKTLDLLLKNRVFTKLRPHSSPFLMELLLLIQAESSCNNVVKIILCAEVTQKMLLFEDPVRSKALKCLIVMLGHRYPRVRKHTAEILYLQFLSDRHAVGPSVEECQLLIDQRLLVTTQWDGKTDEARAKRKELCELLHLKMTVKATDNTKKAPVEAKPKDELDSYASLVATAGY